MEIRFYYVVKVKVKLVKDIFGGMQNNLTFDKKQQIYNKLFSFGFAGKEYTDRVALISLLNYILQKLKNKNPSIKLLDILKKLKPKYMPEENLHSIAIIAEDLGYGCTDFPTFGIEDKKIPEKIKELLSLWVPF